MTRPRLPLEKLADRHAGLTPEIAACYVQAASVCLDRHHAPPTDFTLERHDETTGAVVEWARTDERIRAAWANNIDTTELGAYACVLAAVDLLGGFVAVRRAETGTGADYYIAPYGAAVDDLESCLRLEVSGTDAGAEDAVRQRLRVKTNQASEGNSNVPAIAGVVGFRARLILVSQVIDS